LPLVQPRSIFNLAFFTSPSI